MNTELVGEDLLVECDKHYAAMGSVTNVSPSSEAMAQFRLACAYPRLRAALRLARDEGEWMRVELVAFGDRVALAHRERASAESRAESAEKERDEANESIAMQAANIQREAGLRRAAETKLAEATTTLARFRDPEKVPGLVQACTETWWHSCREGHNSKTTLLAILRTAADWTPATPEDVRAEAIARQAMAGRIQLPDPPPGMERIIEPPPETAKGSGEGVSEQTKRLSANQSVRAPREEWLVLSRRLDALERNGARR